MRVEEVDLKMTGRGQKEKVEARPSEVSWQAARYSVRCTSGFSRDRPLRETLDQYKKSCERSFLAGRSLAWLGEEAGYVTMDKHSSRDVTPPSLLVFHTQDGRVRGRAGDEYAFRQVRTDEGEKPPAQP